MPKVRKLKRRKRFRVNVNRKRLRNRLTKLPNIECKQIKEAWENKRSTVKNLAEMGLAYDPNQVLKIPKVKNEMLKFVKKNGDEVESDTENVEEFTVKKLHVVQSLEEEAKHPRAKLFRLPNNEVHFVTSMMDKYGDDYEAMMRDRKNYNQLTWRQIKAKIERFKSIPEQYAEYLVNKGEIILDDPTPLKKIKPPIIIQEPVEKKENSRPSRRKRKKSKLVDSIWQEESIIEDELINDSQNKSVDNVEIDLSSSDKADGEKKLQLFSDDEDDDNDDDDTDNNISDNEDDIDDSKEIKVCRSKVPLKLRKSNTSKKNTKKLKIR